MYKNHVDNKCKKREKKEQSEKRFASELNKKELVKKRKKFKAIQEKELGKLSTNLLPSPKKLRIKIKGNNNKPRIFRFQPKKQK